MMNAKELATLILLLEKYSAELRERSFNNLAKSVDVVYELAKDDVVESVRLKRVK